MERYILMMIIAKYFCTEVGTSRKLKALSQSPKTNSGLKATLVSDDEV